MVLSLDTFLPIVLTGLLLGLLEVGSMIWGLWSKQGRWPKKLKAKF